MKTKDNRKNESIIGNVLYACLGTALFSYVCYNIYQQNIRPIFSNSEDRAKNIERIVENPTAIKNPTLKDKAYVLSEKNFREYVRK